MSFFEDDVLQSYWGSEDEDVTKSGNKSTVKELVEGEYILDFISGHYRGYGADRQMESGTPFIGVVGKPFAVNTNTVNTTTNSLYVEPNNYFPSVRCALYLFARPKRKVTDPDEMSHIISDKPYLVPKKDKESGDLYLMAPVEEQGLVKNPMGIDEFFKFVSLLTGYKKRREIIEYMNDYNVDPEYNEYKHVVSYYNRLKRRREETTVNGIENADQITEAWSMFFQTFNLNEYDLEELKHKYATERNLFKSWVKVTPQVDADGNPRLKEDGTQWMSVDCGFHPTFAWEGIVSPVDMENKMIQLELGKYQDYLNSKYTEKSDDSDTVFSDDTPF